jgi:(2Fe-2S) ferredoxin
MTQMTKPLLHVLCSRHWYIRVRPPLLHVLCSRHWYIRVRPPLLHVLCSRHWYIRVRQKCFALRRNIPILAAPERWGRRRGGTGRRVGLKIRFWQQSVGSIPSAGTIFQSQDAVVQRLALATTAACLAAGRGQSHSAVTTCSVPWRANFPVAAPRFRIHSPATCRSVQTTAGY